MNRFNIFFKRIAEGVRNEWERSESCQSRRSADGQPTVKANVTTTSLYEKRRESGARVAREAIKAHRRVSCGQSRGKCAARVRRANIEVRKAEWLKFAAVFLLIFTLGVGNAWGTPSVIYTLTPVAGSDNSYAGDEDIDCEDEDNDVTITWNVTGNATMTPWRIGGKGGSKTSSTATLVRDIYCTSALSTDDVSKVILSHGESTITGTGWSINSVTLIVSTSSDGGGTVISSIERAFKASDTIIINRPAGKDWSSRYFTIRYNISAKGTSNKYLEFSGAEFYAESGGCAGTKLGTPVVTATPSDRQVVLTWPNVSNASSYQLKWNGGEWAAATSPVTKSSLTNGTAYTYQVKAIGNGSTFCDGDASTEASSTPNIYYTVTWNNHGSTSTSSVVSGTKPTFPATPSSCDLTCTTFYGWSTSAWSGPITSLAGKTIYTKASDMPDVSGDVTYYAVYSDGSITEYTFTSSGWNATSGGASANWTSGSAGAGYTAGQGVQVTTTSTGANATSPVSFSNVNKVIVTYNTNKTAGAGSIGIKIGSNSEVSNAVAYDSGITDDGRSADFTTEYTFSPVQTGYIKLTANTTTNSIWPKSIAIYSGAATPHYLTTCCTSLGSINGSISLTQGGNSVTISGWTYNAESTGTTESNIASYTVRMYKKNGGGTWDLVSGSTTGGAAGTQGTRTGIATNNKSVTYTGLVVESEYKFTVEAVGATGYCGIDETNITSINSTDVSSTPFKFRYSIYIDDGSGNNWAHHYITPTANADEGSVSITLGAHVDYYQFKIAGGFSGWWGQSGSSKIPANTQWTLNSDQNVRLETGAGGAYVFTIDYSGTTNPGVTVTFPSADQGSGYVIYYDNSVLNWGSLYYRIGNNSQNSNQALTLVPGTDKFYKVTTPNYPSMDAWHIANNYGWSGSNSIYRTKTNAEQSSIAITNSISFQQSVVTEDITIIPTTTHSTGGDDQNNNCQFYTINTPTSGMLTHNVAVGTAAHGTLVATYTNTSGTSGQTVTEGNDADLAHRCILTITAAPDAGYSCTSLTLNGAAFTSGNEHILTADATIAATFTAQTSTVTLDNNDATSGSSQTVTATYDAAMPLTTTSSAAVAALSRTGYTFTGWWDATSGGTQYYTYSGSPAVIASARTWDKTGAQTLKAQWSINNYTLTWETVRGKVTTAGTGADVNATGNVSSSQEYNTALTAPVCGSANGYTFTGWSPDVADNMPAANTTYTAQWSANQYTVTLNNHGATTAGTESVTVYYDADMPDITPPTKTGYSFKGYFTGTNGSGTKYYDENGSGLTVMKMYGATPTLHAHWVAQIEFSVNGVVDNDLTRDVTEDLPSSATVPPACGDCWAFAGWDASSTCSTTPGHAGGENAATHGITTPTTLYAVFGMAEYELIRATSDLEADAYYVLTTLDIDGYEYALKAVLSGNYGTSTDIASQIKEKNSWYYLYNPSSNLVWKFTGNSSSGRLYSESLSKYMDLTGSGSLYKDATSDYLSFSIPDPTYVEFNIASTTTTTQKLHIYNDTEWGPTSSATGIYIYKRQSATYATEPSCETYDIVWKVNGTPTSAGGPTDETNTCAGIETLPTDPANNTLACANVFMGWSEEDLSGPDNEEPDDLFWRSGDAPKITGDKIFNAVFATGTPVANTYKLTSLSNIKDGQTVLIVNHTNNVAVSSTASGTKLSSVSVSPSEETITTSETSIKWTVTKSGDYYVFKSGDNYLRSGGSTLLYCDGTSDKWSISSGTVSGTYLMTSYNNSSYSLEYYNSNFTSYSGTGNAYNVEFYVQAMTYSDYMTNCCTAYTISGASKNGTDVIVSGNTGGTLTSNYNRACAEASVTLSATINPGYAFGGWTITGATSGDLTSTLLPGDNATSLTPAAFEMPGENITVSATITEKTATAWTWTYKSGAIPNPLVMYVNEYHQLDVTYVPSDLLDGQKNYAVTKESSVAQVSKQLAYYKMRGAVGVTSATSSTVTFTLGGLRQDVNVTVKPLPIVTFVDIVHNKTDFANAGSGYTAATGVLTSTVSDGVVTHTQPTPTHSKLDVPGSGNDCELTHLVLIGWIRSDCPDVDNYMRGLGAKPGNAAITEAGNDGEGRAYFVSAGADIDVEDYNTLTFYAVWAKVE